MKIGILDSGIGGLTILADCMDRLPPISYIYYADTENVPYGTKSKEEIHSLVAESAAFLISKKIDLLVLACNTATSTSVAALRRNYDIPIVGMEPAVKPAAELDSSKKILVCATDLTLREKKLNDLIDTINAKDRAHLMSLQKLVEYAEKFDFKSKGVTEYLNKKFSTIKWEDYSSLVLGCTHFIFFRKIIKRSIPPHINIIDGNKGTVNRIIDLLGGFTSTLPHTRTTYYESGKNTVPTRFRKYLNYLIELKRG